MSHEGLWECGGRAGGGVQYFETQTTTVTNMLHLGVWEGLQVLSIIQKEKKQGRGVGFGPRSYDLTHRSMKTFERRGRCVL